MKAKVMVAGVTATEFAEVADNVGKKVNYKRRYGKQYNTNGELAEYIVELINSESMVGIVNNNMSLNLLPKKMPHF